MYCNTVWQGLHIMPYGDIRLCSIGNNSDKALDFGTCRDDNGNLMNILTHSIKDIMNSDKHCGVRAINLMDNEAWSPQCSCCENREQITNFDRSHPNKSRRIYLMQVDNEINETNFADHASPEGKVDLYPRSLDIRFGNLCNQKCIMCDPDHSSLWYSDWSEWTQKTAFNNGRPIQLVKDNHNKWIQPESMQWYDDPRWGPKLDEMAPHLKHIYVTGGEPMVVPAHDIMLDRLIELGYAKNIILEYDTNCSVVNDKIAARWINFKRVDIRGSMDATGAKYDLIRSGGNWDKFVTNVGRLKTYADQSEGKIDRKSVV